MSATTFDTATALASRRGERLAMETNAAVNDADRACRTARRTAATRGHGFGAAAADMADAIATAAARVEAAAAKWGGADTDARS